MSLIRNSSSSGGLFDHSISRSSWSSGCCSLHHSIRIMIMRVRSISSPSNDWIAVDVTSSVIIIYISSSSDHFPRSITILVSVINSISVSVIVSRSSVASSSLESVIYSISISIIVGWSSAIPIIAWSPSISPISPIPGSPSS